jgi:hypothetical protein
MNSLRRHATRKANRCRDALRRGADRRAGEAYRTGETLTDASRLRPSETNRSDLRLKSSKSVTGCEGQRRDF